MINDDQIQILINLNGYTKVVAILLYLLSSVLEPWLTFNLLISQGQQMISFKGSPRWFGLVVQWVHTLCILFFSHSGSAYFLLSRYCFNFLINYMATGCQKWNICHAACSDPSFLYGISRDYGGILHTIFGHRWGIAFCSSTSLLWYLNPMFDCLSPVFFFLYLFNFFFAVCFPIVLFTYLFWEACTSASLLFRKWL